MSTVKTGITLAADGEKEFRQAISNINSDYKVLQSELKKVSAEFSDNANSMEALISKDKVLNEQYDTQKQKIEAVKNALENAKQQYGDNTTKINSWKVSLNNAEADLAKLENEIKKNNTAMSEATADKLTKSLKDLDAESKNTANGLDNIGKKTSIFSNFAESAKANSEKIKTAIGATGVAIAGLLTSSATSAATAEKSTLQLTNLLKNQGETADQSATDIDTFKKSITDMSSFSGGEAKEALTTLTQKGMDVGTSLQWSSTIADVAAGSNRSLSDAADLVADAYNGKTKALVSLGVLTKDEVSQLGDSEEATISYAEVQQRLNAQFGGSAQTELSSYSGQLKENQNQLNASKTAIGKALLPMLTQLMQAITKIVTPLANFVQQHPKITAGILGIIAAVSLLIGGLSLISTVVTSLSTLGIAFGVLTPAVTAVGAASAGASIGIGAMATPILIIIAVIAALVVGIYELYTHWDMIKAGFMTGFNAVKDAVVTFFTATIPGAWNSVVSFFQGIPAFFVGVWNDVTTSVTNAWNSIVAYLGGILTNIWSTITGTFNSVVDGVGGAVGGIWDSVTGTFNNVIGFITGLPGQAIGWGQDFIQGLIDGIKSMISGVTDAVSGVADKIKSFLHFSVPDEGPLTDYESWMPDMMSGLAGGIDANQSKVISSVKNLASNIKANISDVSTNVKADMSVSGTTGQRQNGGMVTLATQDLNNLINAIANKPIVVEVSGKALMVAMKDDVNKGLADLITGTI